MPSELTVECPGRAPERRSVRAAVSAGGSRADGIHLPGAAAGALRLVPAAAGVVVEARAAGVRAAGHPLAPGARRLVRGGERVELGGATLAVACAPSSGGPTRVAAAAILRDALLGEEPLAGAHLVVLTGPAAGARHALAAEQTIGRGRSATIRIPDPQASRVHARVRLSPDGVTIEDLRSKNGVRVDGVRIDRRARTVGDGAEITVGETVLALVAPAAPAAPSPPLAREALATDAPSPPRGAGGGRGEGAAAGRLAAGALLALSAAALALAAS